MPSLPPLFSSLHKAVYQKTTAYLMALSICLISNSVCAESYVQAIEFLNKHDNPIVLESKSGLQKIVVSPTHQGRVMTSTAQGLSGLSNGWIDKHALEQGKSGGGEDRTWIAPIGSKYSLYYPVGTKMSGENWRVPHALLEQNYPIIKQGRDSITFQKKLFFENFQGSHFSTQFTRKVTLRTKAEVENSLGITLSDAINWVSFTADNALMNIGKDWRASNGLITIWSMAMYQGTDDMVSIFPTTIANELNAEKQVNQYLYPLNEKRLRQVRQAILYKTDGRYRSKIGIPANISKNVIGAYSSSLRRLTIVKFSLHKNNTYPISLEEVATKGVLGDVSNAYNHGANDGSILAKPAFFELESAAPMRTLKKGESIQHTQQVSHFFGSVQELDAISEKVLGVKLLDVLRFGEDG